MLEQLLDLAKSQLGSQQDSQGIAQATGQSILSNVLQQAKNGDTSAIQEMFSGKNTEQTSGAVQNMLPGIAGQLTSQFGLQNDQANGFAQQALGVVMNMFNGQVQNAQTDGKQLDIMGVLGSVMGNNSGINLSDGIDMKDVMGAVSMFTNKNGANKEGGGLDIGGLLGSFLGGKK